MKKLLSLTAMVALTISGCEKGNYMAAQATCIGTYPAEVTVRYGDSKLWIDPAELHVKKGQNFKIILAPDDEGDFKDRDVIITPKVRTASWLSGTFNKKEDNPDTFRICVPNITKIQKDDIYGYSVKVPGLGVIDPRVKVID